MDTHEFKTLSIENQIEYINSRLKEGLTLRDVIERELNLTRSTIRDKFKKYGYFYSKKDNVYFKDNNIKIENIKVESNKKSNISNIDKTYAIKKDIKESNMKSNISNISLNEEQITDILELIKYKNDILSLVNKEQLKIIDDKELQGALTVKTFKIYNTILDKFNKFKNNHKDLKQQDIINLALKEFLEKYN